MGTMKAIMVRQPGPPEVFEIEERPIPVPQCGEVLIRVKTCAGMGTDTSVMTAVNGIPWWYFYKTGGQLEGHHLESVDRGGRQWKAIGPERAIGCVVDPACEVVSPGLIVHHEFKRFTIGEPDGSPSMRVQTLARTLTTAGFDAPVRDNVRWNVWLKL